MVFYDTILLGSGTHCVVRRVVHDKGCLHVQVVGLLCAVYGFRHCVRFSIASSTLVRLMVEKSTLPCSGEQLRFAPFTRHMCADRIPLPLTMLPLPGLLVYAIRCLLSRQWHRIHVVPQFRALSLLYASSLGAMMLCTNRFKVRVRDSARSIVNAVLADSAQGATMGNSNL